MHCYICDREDDGISWNSLHKDFNPCFTCQAVINSITFKDKPKKDDELELELDEETDEVLYG